MRLPFFVWAQFVTSFLLLLAFPPLEAAGVLQLMDRLAGTSFFLPSGLVISGKPLTVAGGGNPLLWQHLFWFLAHPEVYVLILPAMGIVAEVIANNTRKPLWGYRALVYSVIFLGFMSFIVWAHHMFMTGMGTTMSAFFQTTTMIISIPSVVILTALLLSLWGASIRFTTPMLFALAFLPMFGIGGLTGLPLGLAPSDIHLHDTYYVIGHFHYVVAPGTIFALFAGVYYWFPKATGRKMNDLLGKIHFWGSFVCINIVFMPMFIQGLGGMNRRMYDGGMQYAHNAGLLKWNLVIGFAAWGLGLFQIPFIINFFASIKWGALVDRNPWEATTLEWSAPSPPGHGNFLTEPVVYRGPYEYSVPGAATTSRRNSNRSARSMEIPYIVEPRPDSGLTNGKLGIWLFLASEVMLFGALFSTYILLRVGARRVAARRAEHQARRHQHRHPHLLVGDDGDGVGVAEAEQLRQGPAVSAGDGRAGGGLPREQVLRVRRALREGRRALAQHVPRDLFHADRPARAAHHRRHRRDGVSGGPGREAVEEEPGAVHEPHREHGALLALRRPGVDFPVSRVCICSRRVSNAFRSGRNQEEHSQLRDRRRRCCWCSPASRWPPISSTSRCRSPSPWR